MANNIDKIIKERLENRLEWKNYLSWLLTHRDLYVTAKREFYRDKPILNFITKLYFLPYNTLKRLIYLFDRHKLQMIECEIKMLQNLKKDQNEKEL